MNKKRIAIITGASSGLGREFVRLLCARNDIDEIWAVARSSQRLDKVVEELNNKVVPYPVDLTNEQSMNQFKMHIHEQKPDIVYLVNNAGYAKFCSWQELPPDQSQNMISLNCQAMVTMCLACLPHMPFGSRIINVSSQSAFQPTPYMTIYGATKAFIRSYSRALNIELCGKGISVTVVCPGWMNTGLFERAEIGARKTISRFGKLVSPEKVAQKALRDSDKGRDMSVYGIKVKLLHIMAKLMPQSLSMRLWLMQQKL